MTAKGRTKSCDKIGGRKLRAVNGYGDAYDDAEDEDDEDGDEGDGDDDEDDDDDDFDAYDDDVLGLRC